MFLLGAGRNGLVLSGFDFDAGVERFVLLWLSLPRDFFTVGID